MEMSEVFLSWVVLCNSPKNRMDRFRSLTVSFDMWMI